MNNAIELKPRALVEEVDTLLSDNTPASAPTQREIEAAVAGKLVSAVIRASKNERFNASISFSSVVDRIAVTVVMGPRFIIDESIVLGTPEAAGAMSIMVKQIEAVEDHQ